MTTEREPNLYRVIFDIQMIDAFDPREAAQTVAEMLAEEGYAHQAVYFVTDENTDERFTVDLAEPVTVTPHHHTPKEQP